MQLLLMQKLSHLQCLMTFKETFSSPPSLPRDLEKYLITDQIMIHSYHVRLEHFPIHPLEEPMDAQNARQVC